MFIQWKPPGNVCLTSGRCFDREQVVYMMMQGKLRWWKEKACRGWKENDGNQSTISKPELDSSCCHRGQSRKGRPSNFTSPVSASKQIINKGTTN